MFVVLFRYWNLFLLYLLMLIFLLAVKQNLVITLPKELFLLSAVWVISPCHLFTRLYSNFVSYWKEQIILGNRKFLNEKWLRKVLGKLLWNAWVSYRFSASWTVFDVGIYSRTLLSACPWFLWILFWQISVWEMLYL